jgi:hypothetical protein
MTPSPDDDTMTPSPVQLHVQVDLSRLTNLTELDFNVDGSNASFAAASQLRNSLQVLDITAPAAPAAVFMGLSQLRSLTIYQDLLPMPAVLQKMNRNLKQLTHLDLGAKTLPFRLADDGDFAPMFFGCQEVEELAEALAALPLRKLNLMRPGHLRFFVPELHRLTQLTALTLSDLSAGGAMFHGFGIVEQQLRELTALEQLELEGPLHGLLNDSLPAGFLHGPPQPQSFMQTIARLPNLQWLALQGMKLGNAAAELQAAVRLTHVDLRGSECSPEVRQVLRHMCVRNEAADGRSDGDESADDSDESD